MFVPPGLYTSPHLIAVRERIRVNGDPVSEEAFAKFFFDVWDRLEGSASVSTICLFIKCQAMNYFLEAS
jgi:folylpolyglutamate synthase/dihydropteroate synthase